MAAAIPGRAHSPPGRSFSNSTHPADDHRVRPGRRLGTALRRLGVTDGARSRQTPRVHMQSGTIQSSIFSALDIASRSRSGGTASPSSPRSTFGHFGDAIDFHADLRRGDRFNVIMRSSITEAGPSGPDAFSPQSSSTGGSALPAYLFQGADGREDYYSQDGRSHKAGFLRSPLWSSPASAPVSRCASIRYWASGANTRGELLQPHGTAVEYTDGIVEFVGQQNGCRNFIVLRHGEKIHHQCGHLSGLLAG